MYYNYQEESDNVVMSRFSGIVKQFFNYFDYVTSLNHHVKIHIIR